MCLIMCGYDVCAQYNNQMEEMICAEGQQVSAILELVTDDDLRERRIRLRNQYLEEKQAMLERLRERKEDLTVQKKNRYAYCLDELQEGLEMFLEAVRKTIDLFFPLVLQERYMDLLTCDELQEKVEGLQRRICKYWDCLLRELTRGKDDDPIPSPIRRIKKEERSRRRGVNCKIAKQSACYLEIWLLQNFNDPYPTNLKKSELAKQSGLTLCQVNNWFINARERIVKKFHKKETPRLIRELSQI